MPYTNGDDDSPEAHEEAALGALILADALEVNGLPTMGDLMKRPDARRLIDEARDRVARGSAT